jgi:hypothetical protein
MNKKQITSAKEAIALAFEGSGGLQKFINWCRTHPEQFYTQLYIKLLPFNITAQVDVNVHNADAARSALQDAFERLVAAGDLRDVRAIEHRTIEHDPQPVAEPPEQILRARSFSADPPEQKTGPPPPLIAKNDNVPVEAKRRAMDPSYRPPIMNTASAEMSTTEKYFEWASNSGSGFWANLPGRVTR